MMKKILIIGLAIFVSLLALPTFVPSSTNYLPSFFKPINLGLDLKGGAHLLMEVDTDIMMKEKNAGLYDGVRSALIDRDRGLIRFSDLKFEDGKVSFNVRNKDDISKTKGRIRSVMGDTIDITQNNGRFEVSYNLKQEEEIKKDAISRSIEIVRRRIDSMGTKELSIQQQGSQYIVVQLPGVDNPEHIKDLIGKTAKMTFHLVNENVSQSDIAKGRIPAGTELLHLADNPNVVIPIYKRVEVSGESLTDSKASFDQNNMPVVTTVFDSDGARRFAKLTTDHVNERFAIVLDDIILSAPVIREPIPGGRGQISGGFSTQEANDLSVLLRSGALPAPLNVIEERTIGPGLGEDSIQAGQFAAVVGIILIVIFMILVYRLFGIFADTVLIVNMLMLIGIMALFGATLTLPGIAGIVLTLGVAVDGNILVFERIREEIKAGASIRKAVDSGFDRAMATIMDANLTTLISALVLFQFGAGPIRGFAVTLTIGILTTLFTCVPLSRIILNSWVASNPKKIPYIKD